MSSSWDLLVPCLSPGTRRTVVDKMGFSSMTPVQRSTIPLFLGLKDVAVEAVTGSGKTLAFVIPIMELLKKVSLSPHQVGALILSPTQELASQISEVIQEFISDPEVGLTQILAIGGRGNAKSDMEKFSRDGGNIIVGTPGRIEELFSSSEAALLRSGLKSLEVLVLDEADRLLSLGFHAAVTAVMSALPKQRRTGLFSATQTKDVEKLIRAGLRNPVIVSVKEKKSASDSSTPSSLNNFYLTCSRPEQKLSILVEFLKRECTEGRKILLFFSTCASVEYFSLVLSRLLRSSRVKVSSIHGKKSKRHKVFEEFKKAEPEEDEGMILACTDVMARGIDIPDVEWVVQFDPPSSAEAFVHRCGRTARRGKKGSAVVFLLPTEEAYVNFIELNQKVTLHPLPADRGGPLVDVPDLVPVLRDWQRNDRSVFDKANRAFVSFVQAYSKHECKYILRLKDLPFGSLASSYGLLKLPRMPELKNRKVEGFVEDKKIVTNDIKYKDKQKEKSRQDKLDAYSKTGSWPGFSSNKRPREAQAWSEKAKKRQRKEERRRKKEMVVMSKKKKKEEEAEDEVDGEDDLDEDYRLLMKARKAGGGKNKAAAEEEFDRNIELDNDGSE